jgi:ubiquitin-activating enzyme E1
MSSKDTIDESLYSRQLYVLGHDAMKQMSSSNVLIVGALGLGAEIAKNIALAGVKSVTLYDPKPVMMSDLSSQFFLRKEDVGKPGVTRASATASRLAELNSYVPIKALDVPSLDTETLQSFKVVVMTHALLSEQLRVNDMTHGSGTHFLSADVRGLFGTVFADLGTNFTCKDTNGEPPMDGIVVSVTQDKEGLVTTIDEKRHGLQDGDFVTFSEVQGMTELNGIEPRRVTVKGPYTFTIGDTSSFGQYKGGGLFKQVKMPEFLNFKSLRESLAAPECIISDFAKMDRPIILHAAFEALSSFEEQHGRSPRPRSKEDARAVVEQAQAILQSRGQLPEGEEANKLATWLTTELAFQATGDLSPMVAFIGGFVAQEVLKACSGKFHPLLQHMYVDVLEALPKEVPSLPESEFAPIGSRYDGQIAVFGKKFQERIANTREFLVGSGAIGCEMLKNWSMMGLGTGPQGQIFVTDLDTIEKSNLNRQFLFRTKDVGKFKSDTAAEAVVDMNPELKGKITTFQHRVGPETENVYDRSFFDGLDGVTNALDNVAARHYMDSRCVFFRKPLLESGTLGTKANTQVVVPDLTESYSSSQDPPEKSIPVCTLKNFPNQIEHTIQWAREQFDELFEKPAANVNQYLTQSDYLSSLASAGDSGYAQQVEQIKEYLVDARPQTFDACIVWARLKFEENYVNIIKQLLFNLPPDAKTTTGQPFWSGPKRAPKPLVFDAHNELHLAYIVAAANIHAFNYGLHGSTDVAHIADVASRVQVPEFVPREAKVQINDNDPAPTSGSGSNAAEDQANVEEVASTLPAPSSMAGYRMSPADFEKDDDTNHHIDFITAASNLRATNYQIEPVDRYTTKGIAGKIIPAIATTTALVTGLVNLELYKLLDNKRKLESYSNAFVNLALPFIAFSDPMPAPVHKFNDEEWTLWSRFEVDDMSLRDFIQYFHDKHGLDITLVSGNMAMLYADFMPPKKKEERLPMRMRELVEHVTKKPIDQCHEFLSIEIMADDRNGEDVEVPSVTVRIR